MPYGDRKSLSLYRADVELFKLLCEHTGRKQGPQFHRLIVRELKRRKLAVVTESVEQTGAK